ncbi:unnamed protein product [Acanthoscelides obtectus]|uniref:C2H2-type domain-containing protein n=1 Tax=Acanthoscelides obtectus TaxID=200917 RepID=A0A9P0PYC5_ACAOB|nr:unnamed protein product [Acanthoscelides obtectus]CAK1665088.1 Zinc finger protein 711 [Acanthoscelides obtectus]
MITDAGDIMKIEVGEVEFQAVEADTKLFELDNASWKLNFKYDNENSKNSVLDRIKSEAEEELKVENCPDDSEKYPVMEITEECIIKDECDNDDAFLGTNAGSVPVRASNQVAMKQQPVVDKKSNLGSFFGHNGDYSARSKYLLIRNMKGHRNQNSKNMHGSSYDRYTCKHCHAKFITKTKLDVHVIRKHPDFVASVSSKILEGNFASHMLKHSEIENNYKFSLCIHCKAKFKSKTALNDHLIKKHPDFIASVSSKIHECTRCAYKTTFTTNFASHMLKHSETENNYKFSICIHCSAKFRGKMELDNHIIKKHPDFIASISSKIHECTQCTYKTTLKSHFVSHMLKHPEAENNKFSICIQCKAKFRSKTELNNHIIKKHPDLIASISSKIYECTHCAYKTTLKSHFVSHMLKHPEAGNNESSMCFHCQAKFRSKRELDNHIIKKHPDFIASVSSKIHECTHCEYKTTIKTSFVSHMLKHPEAGNNASSMCIHCQAKFRSKRELDNHIIKKHPDLIASVSSKIHECTHCAYKTTLKSHLVSHMLKHPETGTIEFSMCIHCQAKFRNTMDLDNHIIKKHPDFIASVSSKIHECTHCEYKTTIKTSFVSHMLKHPEAGNNESSMCIHCQAKFRSKRELDNHIIKKHPDLIASVSSKILEGNFASHMLKHSEIENNYKFSICIHCKEKFRSKMDLSNHVIKKHPDFIASVSSKIHECTHCEYKTTIKTYFVSHMLKHPEAGNNEFSMCIHCQAKFRSKMELNNHIIKKHPEFIASISSKMHECTHCTYKTTLKSHFVSHMMKHPEAGNNYKFSICIHCKAKFRGKTEMNNHIIKKHPDFIASISAKIHECTHCEYKTTIKTCFVSHMLKHPEAGNNEFSMCTHCQEKFRSKMELDNHIIKKHPDFIASISSKMHECTHCTYKTTLKSHFVSHMMKHPEAGNNYKFSICIHCKAKFRGKTEMNNHIIKKHPDFIASVSGEIYECAHCAYKTPFRNKFGRHMLIHSAR